MARCVERLGDVWVVGDLVEVTVVIKLRGVIDSVNNSRMVLRDPATASTYTIDERIIQEVERLPV